MNDSIQRLATVVVFTALASGCDSGSGGGGAGGASRVSSVPAEPFTVASVHFEQNATDGDVEVVFDVKGGAEGLAGLWLIAPNGRIVADFTASDTMTLGIQGLGEQRQKVAAYSGK